MADSLDKIIANPVQAKAELERLSAEVAQLKLTNQHYRQYVAELELRLARCLPRTLERAAAQDIAAGPTLFDSAEPEGSIDEQGQSESSKDPHDQGPPPASPADPAQGAGPGSTPKRPPALRRGRTPIPPHIPREEILHPVILEDLPDYDPTRGHSFLSPEISEQLDIVRPQLRAFRHIRQTVLYYTLAGEKRIVTAGGPAKVFDKGLPTAQVLADVANKRYHLHQPLYRIQMDYRQLGYTPQRITLCHWMLNAGEILMPVWQCMRQQLLGGFKIHLDDTKARILAPGSGTTVPCLIWVMLGGRWEKEHVVFLATSSRTSAAVDGLLKDFGGYLQIDACRVYEHLPQVKNKRACFCWSHVLRKFQDVAVIDSRAKPMLEMIGQIYEVEERSADKSAAERHALRQQHTRPILERIWNWVSGQRVRELISSGFKLALNYVDNQWHGRQRFLDDGRLRPDNNPSEGEFHTYGVNRRNHLFYGTEKAVPLHLAMYSLCRSCVANAIDPYVYFQDVLKRISVHPASRILELTPAHWKDLVGYVPPGGPRTQPLSALESG